MEFLGDKNLRHESCGGKAAPLHRLAGEPGMRVPPGFVIAHDAEPGRIPDAELEAAVARLGGWPVAVRSSGLLEDLEGASFAGQYKTFLDVSGLSALREAIAACRASGESEAVRAYLGRNGLGAKAPVSVLVQKMVDPSAAGVAFSIHPLTGREEHALVESCGGLGEKLVSGRITPTSYVVDLLSGAPVEELVGDPEGRLGPDQLRELAGLLLKLQAIFGRPQDVEWALDRAGSFWILQSRPVTKIQWRSDVEEFTNADLKDGGVSARPCTPLMFSLYCNAMQGSMQKYFEGLGLIPRSSAPERWIETFYGRVYWNASAVKRALSKVPGFDEERFDLDLGIQKSYGPGGPLRVPATLRTLLGAVPVALALESSYRRQLRRTARFGERFAVRRAAWLHRTLAFPRTGYASFFRDLAAVLDDFHLETEQTYFTTIYNNANAQTDFKSFVAKMDSATGEETAVIRLLGGLADVSHMQMQRGLVGLCAVARSEGFESEGWRAALALFLESNGFHADAELDLTVPRWSERPERVTELVRSMLAAGAEPADPVLASEAQRRQYEAELERVVARLKSHAGYRLRFLPGFRRHLARVRAYLSRRELMREYSTQCYHVVRLYVLEAGRRLAERGKLERADDVFMLHAAEILDLATDDLPAEAAQPRIAYRRAIHEGYRDASPPNELGRGVRQRGEESYRSRADGRTFLRGVGCSAGLVEGTVRVVASLDEIRSIQSGDILVTRFTDPAWTPVLGLVSGIVTEVGGLLSHAAVIGREYGIPAVLNLPGATRALSSGQRVRVDGTSGTVEVLA